MYRQMALITFLMFSLIGCAIFGKRLWNEFPMKTQPDYSCTRGNGESGIVYYLWECYERKRVLIYNRGSGIYWSSNHREEGKCGIKTKYELERRLDIKDKTKCYEKFPFPYQSQTTKGLVAKLVKDDQLHGCDNVGHFSSYKDSRAEAIKDLIQKLSTSQIHAFTEPIFDKGIINEDKWISKGFVCYGWNNRFLKAD